MEPLEFAWFNTRGIKIVGQDWQPEGEPRGVVALLHGLGEHVGRYRHVAEALNGAGFGLIGFDLPGHGKSAGTRGHTSYDDSLEEIDHLLRQASVRYPGKPRFLYGHSLGGALVLYYALKRRPSLQGFIATSPGLGVDASPAKVLFAKVMAAVYPSFTVNNGLDRNNLSHDPAVIQAYNEDPLVHPRVSARLGLDLLTKGAWITEHAPDFPGPLLLVQGNQDHLVSPLATRAFAEKVPSDKVTFKVWENLYHETHNEPAKTRVIQFMINWICQQSEQFHPETANL